MPPPPLKLLIADVRLYLKLWQSGDGFSNARLTITTEPACVDGHSVAADDHVVGVADFLVVPRSIRWRGGGGLVGAGRGEGRSETNEGFSRRGLGFYAERCHPRTRAAQSRLSSRTDIEALGETRRQRRAGHGVSALPHT